MTICKRILSGGMLLLLNLPPLPLPPLPLQPRSLPVLMDQLKLIRKTPLLQAHPLALLVHLQVRHPHLVLALFPAKLLSKVHHHQIRQLLPKTSKIQQLAQLSLNSYPIPLFPSMPTESFQSTYLSLTVSPTTN